MRVSPMQANTEGFRRWSEYTGPKPPGYAAIEVLGDSFRSQTCPSRIGYVRFRRAHAISNCKTPLRRRRMDVRSAFSPNVEGGMNFGCDGYGTPRSWEILRNWVCGNIRPGHVVVLACLRRQTSVRTIPALDAAESTSAAPSSSIATGPASSAVLRGLHGGSAPIAIMRSNPPRHRGAEPAWQRPSVAAICSWRLRQRGTSCAKPLPHGVETRGETTDLRPAEPERVARRMGVRRAIVLIIVKDGAGRVLPGRHDRTGIQDGPKAGFARTK